MDVSIRSFVIVIATTCLSYQCAAQDAHPVTGSDPVSVSLSDQTLTAETSAITTENAPADSAEEVSSLTVSEQPTPVLLEGGVNSYAPGIEVTWASANSNYRRLYFEEKLLERHGLTDNQLRTAVRSGVRFYTRAITFPFYSCKYRPNDFQSPYSLGQPGSKFCR